MPVRRTSAAIAAIAAAGLVPAFGATAMAAGHGHGGAHAAHAAHAAAPGQARQLTHQISGLDQRLSRLESSQIVTSLADTDEQALDANIEADRAQLATLAAGVSTMSPADVTAARRQLHSFRVENYVLAVTILHSAEDLATAAATVPAAQDDLTQAVSAALALTASSSKSDVRTARSFVDAAQTAIDDATGGTTTPTDPTGSGDNTTA